MSKSFPVDALVMNGTLRNQSATTPEDWQTVFAAVSMGLVGSVSAFVTAVVGALMLTSQQLHFSVKAYRDALVFSKLKRQKRIRSRRGSNARPSPS